jgi:hypothetical protein
LNHISGLVPTCSSELFENSQTLVCIIKEIHVNLHEIRGNIE